MFTTQIPIFKMFGFSVAIDLTWLILAVLVTWRLAVGLFPALYPDLDPTAYRSNGGHVLRVAGILPAEQTETFILVSSHLMEKSVAGMLFRGIPAGFLVAAMVWMIPGAKGSEFWLITLKTYKITLGGLSHVIAPT